MITFNSPHFCSSIISEKCGKKKKEAQWLRHKIDFTVSVSLKVRTNVSYWFHGCSSMQPGKWKMLEGSGEWRPLTPLLIFVDQAAVVVVEGGGEGGGDYSPRGTQSSCVSALSGRRTHAHLVWSGVCRRFKCFWQRRILLVCRCCAVTHGAQI